MLFSIVSFALFFTFYLEGRGNVYEITSRLFWERQRKGQCLIRALFLLSCCHVSSLTVDMNIKFLMKTVQFIRRGSLLTCQYVSQALHGVFCLFVIACGSTVCSEAVMRLHSMDNTSAALERIARCIWTFQKK